MTQKKLKFNFAELAGHTLNTIGTALVDQARSNMDQISYGRVYIIGGKRHIASKRGDSPNNLSRDLRGTIRFETQGRTMEFGAGDQKVDYAKHLENKAGLDRPNIVKSVEQRRSEIEREVAQFFVKSLKVSNA